MHGGQRLFSWPCWEGIRFLPTVPAFRQDRHEPVALSYGLGLLLCPFIIGSPSLQLLLLRHFHGQEHSLCFGVLGVAVGGAKVFRLALASVFPLLSGERLLLLMDRLTPW